MSEDLYNRRGCLKHFENFSSNFTDKLYVTFENKGGGTAFQNLFFGINMRIESTYEYGGTSPPPPRLRYYALFSRMNKDKYILCM